MKIKKLLSLSIICICLSNYTVKADETKPDINVWIDGYGVVVTGVQLSASIPADLVNNRVFIPLRVVLENYYKTWNNYVYDNKQLSVNWDDKTKTVTVPGVFTHVIGTSYVTMVDGLVVDIGVPSYIKDNRTMVSIRLFAEALGDKVLWNDSKRRVDIYTKEAITRYTTAQLGPYLEGGFNLWRSDTGFYDN